MPASSRRESSILEPLVPKVLYSVGDANPGIGVPMCLLGGEHVTDAINEDVTGGSLLILSAVTSWNDSAPWGAEICHGLTTDSITTLSWPGCPVGGRRAGHAAVVRQRPDPGFHYPSVAVVRYGYPERSRRLRAS